MIFSYVVGLEGLTEDGNDCPLTGNFIHILRATEEGLIIKFEYRRLYYFSTHGREDSLTSLIIGEIALGSNFDCNEAGWATILFGIEAFNQFKRITERSFETTTKRFGEADADKCGINPRIGAETGSVIEETSGTQHPEEIKFFICQN
jgi:hypothetical protein